MSTEESFARAIQTTQLKLGREDEAPRDAERILAAGAAQTQHDGESWKDAQERSLGHLLARLRIEWDASSGDVQLMLRRSEAIRAQRAEEWKARDKRAEPFDFEAFDEATARELFTARHLILGNLRSLAPARQAMLAFTIVKAERMQCGSPELRLARCDVWWAEGVLLRDLTDDERRQAGKDHAKAVRIMAARAFEHTEAMAALLGQVIDAWLDRLCYRCNGRGFTGGYTAVRVQCPSRKQGGCAGTGSKRAARFGTTDAQHMFALWLLNTMDTKVAGAMGRMAGKTRTE